MCMCEQLLGRGVSGHGVLLTTLRKFVSPRGNGGYGGIGGVGARRVMECPGKWPCHMSPVRPDSNQLTAGHWVVGQGFLQLQGWVRDLIITSF